MKKSILILFLFTTISLFSQQVDLRKIEPPNWWINMNNSKLQLMVYGKNISLTDVVINSKKIILKKVSKVQNPNYLFVDLEIQKDAKPGNFDILFKTRNKTKAKYTYKLAEKPSRKRGFSSSDLIYLLMPDRFANGNPENDNPKKDFPSFKNLESLNRQNPDGRHGGDIQGIIKNLDYIQDLGATALWINPTLENNNPSYSYHGYAITDFYKTDPRMGTNADYKKLSDELHKKNMKLIMDMIFNHCSENHWWMKDLPSDDWINTNKNYHTNYRGSTIMDPHASQYDKKKFSEGWFVSSMPDLNQHNPFLANYLIQNSIWWINYADLDGIRMDTYPYPFKDFMQKWAIRLHNEFPDITLLGETWLHKVPYTAYFSGNSPISGNYNSHLDCITDFPLYYATKAAFNEKEGWNEGLLRIYNIFAQDFLYAKPENNVIFLDNHDLDRYFSDVGENMNKFKLGITVLLTARGIPVIYYGTEILKTGFEHEGHGHIRTDFPGGWKEDKINAFTETGRTKKQNEAFNFVRKLAKYRKTSKPLTEGKFLHFIPENNVYVYFRYTKNKAVMILLNNNDTEKRTVNCKRFSEILNSYKTGTDIFTGKIYNLDKIELNKKSALILELKN
ncbi:MAG: glycoside hydrolase family 13 protein [Bacteroidales bacterium]|nr:glycoside hydrolase family 13 protein [Bacteroidales bacterium]